MLVAFVRYGVLLECESLIHVDLIPLFVIQNYVAPTYSSEKPVRLAGLKAPANYIKFPFNGINRST